MDNKNEDSGGSDSLDKNLQQKCKVDDLNQTDGNSLVVELTTPAKQIDSVGDGADVREKHLDNELNNQFEQINSFHKSQKTENYSNVNGINAAATEARESSLRFFKASSTITSTIFSRDDSGNSIGNCNVNSSNNNSLGSGCNIESSVKQISQNLKETKLENSKPPTTISASTSSTSLDIPITTTPSDTVLSNLDDELKTPSAVDDTSENAISITEVDSSTVIDSDVADNVSDTRSKKVRFHPDVKENDGGNRVVPKKKKKNKALFPDEGPSVSAKVSGGGTADMELDECGEEIHDDEEFFNMDNAMMEVENYLKVNPITFVSSMTAVRETASGEKVLPPNGLMFEEDLESLAEEEWEKNDKHDGVGQENGVRCIFGRRFINGQCAYLLCYADKPGLYWQNEDYITKYCPKLLTEYERDQQQQQEHLMMYVSKRLNLRQRYTNF